MVENAIAERARSAHSHDWANTSVAVWSTDTVGARERGDYWREVVCGTLFDISVESMPEHFSAQIASRSFGPLRFVKSESTEYRIARNRSEIARGPEHYSIYLQISGRSVSVQGDETVVLGPNEIMLYDGRQPFRGSHSGQRAIMVLPQEMVHRRAPWLRRRGSHKLDANSPFIHLVRQHVVHLSTAELSMSGASAGTLAENLCNLLALVSANDVRSVQLTSELQIEAMLVLCRQSLDDPELAPGVIADRLGISTRTLHARFKQVGQTFGQWILTNRLNACRAALGDPQQQSRNIAEIAYSCGFNDLSYFNRSFRTRFDMTPGEYRASVGAGALNAAA